MKDKQLPQINENEAKRLGKWAKWFLIVSAIILVLNLPAIIRDRFSPPAPYEATQRLKTPERFVKHIKIAGQDMNVPVSYFFTPPSSGTDQKAAHLIVMFPGFLPPSESSRVLVKKGEWYKNIRILIDDQKKFLPWKDLIRTELETHHAAFSEDTAHGLKVYKKPNGSFFEKEIFVNGDISNPRSYISCTRNDLQLHAQCSHRMKIDNLIITIDYNRKLIAHWAEIQKSVDVLVESFQR